jgi:ABC-type branched-subunit amino acid transport system ATPase component
MTGPTRPLEIDELPRPEAGGPRLACAGITVNFGGLIAVSDVALEVPGGAIVGLVGPNGAGKTTVFGVLSGLLRPSHGWVALDGEDITDARPQVRAARGLARTFQHPELFTGLSVRDHLVLAYRAKHAKRRVWSDLVTMGSLRKPEAAEDQAVDDLVELLGLGPVAHRQALGLPLGQARLVELGRALAASPTVVLLDEPSSGLDTAETAQFEATLRKVSRERDLSVLLVEHDVDLVMRLSSRVYVLDFGLLIASGPPDDIRADPAVRAAYLGEELDDDAGAPAPVITTRVAGSKRAPADPSVPLLAVTDLRVRYGDATALSGVSFELRAGSVLAVLGANGAGKSTLARALSGLVPASGGSVRLGGEDVSSWAAHRIRHAGVVYLPEGRGVFRGLTVVDNLRMAAGAVKGRQARRDAVERALDIFPPLAARRRQLAGLLSGGEQQMLSFARALATSPDLVIADEMSLGLAPIMVDLVFDGLARARDAGVTLIMIEQYVHRALAFADDCMVLVRGEAAWQGAASAAADEALRHYLGDAMTGTA